VQVYRKTVSAKVTLEKENKNTKTKLEHVKIQSKQLLKIKQELEEERDRAVTRYERSSSHTHAHTHSLTYQCILIVCLRLNTLLSMSIVCRILCAIYFCVIITGLSM